MNLFINLFFIINFVSYKMIIMYSLNGVEKNYINSNKNFQIIMFCFGQRKKIELKQIKKEKTGRESYAHKNITAADFYHVHSKISGPSSCHRFETEILCYSL